MTATVQPRLVVIAAIAEANRVIGHNGHLPWSIPDDLQRFKALTWGHTVVFGRKTWEHDLQKRALPGRRNIVITRHPIQYLEAATQLPPATALHFAPSISAALEGVEAGDTVFIAGGASIYAQTLPQADRFELTLVQGQFSGDTVFPEYEALLEQQFEQIFQESHAGFRFETYERLA